MTTSLGTADNGRELVAGAYRHFKGNPYWVHGVVRHSETQEAMILYQALYGEGGLWVRPFDMFASEVDHEKYPEITATYRFEKIDDSQVADLLARYAANAPFATSGLA